MLEKNPIQHSNVHKEEIEADQPDHEKIIRKFNVSEAERPEANNSNNNTATNDNNKPKVTRNKRRHRKLSKTQSTILWRRNKLSEYLVKGVSVQEASNIMKIPYKTLWDDMSVLKQEAKENMQNHVTELPWHIKQACDGLNQVIKILYQIQDLDNAIQRRTSDNVRVLALSQIREAIKLKLEVLTSQGAVEDALQFIESTKQLKIVKDQYNHDMQQVREQDKEESLPIIDALTNQNVNGNNITITEDNESDDDESELEQQEQLEEEEQALASQYSQPITKETIAQREHQSEDTDADTDVQTRLKQQRQQYQRHYDDNPS